MEFGGQPFPVDESVCIRYEKSIFFQKKSTENKNMRTIAICDDEQEQVHKIHAAVEAFLSARKIFNVTIRDFFDTGAFLSFIAVTKKIDIALLDICMGEVSGIELAQKIREKGGETKIIFLTTSKEFAIDAFSVNASHYLVKPFSQAAFNEAMSRCADMLETAPEPCRITIHGEGESVTMLDINEIYCIESIGRRRYVRTAKGEFTETRRTLSQFAEELEALSPRQFILPYRGYIVNLSAVRTIAAKNFVLKDGSKVPIKPGDLRALKEKLFAYVF